MKVYHNILENANHDLYLEPLTNYWAIDPLYFGEIADYYSSNKIIDLEYTIRNTLFEYCSAFAKFKTNDTGVFNYAMIKRQSSDTPIEDIRIFDIDTATFLLIQEEFITDFLKYGLSYDILYNGNNQEFNYFMWDNIIEKFGEKAIYFVLAGEEEFDGDGTYLIDI
jgi:hypothetical protein